MLNFLITCMSIIYIVNKITMGLNETITSGSNHKAENCSIKERPMVPWAEFVFLRAITHANEH
jgi:hypothetical protein